MSWGPTRDDKMGRLGYLQSLLLRAARLVADTGITGEGTRADAITYLETTVGLARSEAEFEVDRYTIWPGQACAYMTGRETIKTVCALTPRRS